MKKALIISKEYYPISNGSVTCLSNLLEQFTKEFTVDVVTFKDDKSEAIHERLDDCNIIRLSHWSDDIMTTRINWLATLSIKQQSIKKTLAAITKLPLIPLYLVSKKSGLLYNDCWAQNGYRNLNTNLDLNSYDFVLAMGAPFENLDLAMRVAKKKNIPLYIMQLDLFSYNPTNDLKDQALFKYRLEKEFSWYEAADQVFVTNEMYDAMKETKLMHYKKKIMPIQMPNLKKPNLEFNVKSYEDGKDINVLYTGMFYEDIRNPKYMLKVFEKIFIKYPNIKLHIIGFGCEDIINKYIIKYPFNILFYGRKGKKDVLDAMNSADILLNVSNKTITQAPSKIIEYISTGKPIVNFHSVDGDICEKILNSYEYSYSIREDFEGNSEAIIEELFAFMKNYKGKQQTFESIQKSYIEYTPEFVAEKMLKKIRV